MNEDWVRSIRDQVTPWKIPFFFKQKYIGRKKISTPLLDNIAWQQYPDFLINEP
jgi:protein gp37